MAFSQISLALLLATICSIKRNRLFFRPSAMLLFALASTLLLASLAAAQNLTSPASVTECLPQQLEISGGTPPYTVTILPGGQTGAAPLETLPTVEDPGTVTWLVNLPAGQKITFAVRDSTGAVGYSSEIPQVVLSPRPPITVTDDKLVGQDYRGYHDKLGFRYNLFRNPLSVDPAATHAIASGTSSASATGSAASAKATKNGLGRTAKTGLESFYPPLFAAIIVAAF
ncbi:hypothetical protein JCM5296_002364 [Sporobolomyces johnsonii]